LAETVMVHGAYVCAPVPHSNFFVNCFSWEKYGGYAPVGKSNLAQNFWVFRLCTSSGILKTTNNISETGSLSILRWGGHLLCWVP
jgi:hypothetical protein